MTLFSLIQKHFPPSSHAIGFSHYLYGSVSPSPSSEMLFPLEYEETTEGAQTADQRKFSLSLFISTIFSLLELAAPTTPTVLLPHLFLSTFL